MTRRILTKEDLLRKAAGRDVTIGDLAEQLSRTQSLLMILGAGIMGAVNLNSKIALQMSKRNSHGLTGDQRDAFMAEMVDAERKTLIGVQTVLGGPQQKEPGPGGPSNGEVK